MKRLLKYIFIPVLAILLMSHNVFAVDMSPNVHPIWANANPTCSFYVRNTDVWQNDMFSNNTTGTSQTYSVSKINCDYPEGLNTVKTYAVYSFRFDNFAYDNSADSGWLASKISSVSGSADWGVIGQEVSSTGSTGWQLDLYLYSTKASNGGTFQIYNPLYANEIFYLKPQERITFLGASYWQVTTETDLEYNYTDVLNAISTKLDTSNSHLQTIRRYSWEISSKLDNLGQNTADAINDGQADATQDAADDSSTAGSSSQSSAEGATSNLLSVFASFANIITNASPTSCVISGPLNTTFSNDNFSVDLCGLDLPSGISAITSIIAVMVVVPFAISMFNKFIGIMESFQR